MHRLEAFWAADALDRPVVQMALEKPPDQRIPLPLAHQATSAERWLDIQYQVELTCAQLSNREYLGETLPVAFPNLGPEVLAAFYGCPLHFGDYGTSWTDPVLYRWEDAPTIQLDWQHPYFRNLADLTDALLEAGRGKFLTGLPDWHSGGDLVAALRDPQQLAIDLIEHPEEVRQLLGRLQVDYFKIYDFWYDKVHRDGLPTTSWLELAAYGRYYIPSNDFSGMISSRMFADFFLEGIIAECRFLDTSIYHLDGPGALRHLDLLLAIPELNALQWVPGAGNEVFARWVPVYQRAQRTGKAIIVYCAVQDLPLVQQTLQPQGLALGISGVTSRQMGEAILADLEKWTTTVKTTVNHRP